MRKIGNFFLLFVPLMIAGIAIFPIDQATNTSQVPDWYLFLVATVSVLFAALASSIKRTVQSSAVNNKQRNLGIASTYNALYIKAVNVILETNQASVSMLQRKMNLDYHSAAKIMNDIEAHGIVGPFNNSTPRSILIRKEDWDAEMQLNRSNPLSVNFDFASNKKNEKIEDIDFMEGHAFEYWCANLLQKNGFLNVEVTQGSGDQGVDILAEKDGIKYAIQCKCYSSDLGNKPIQEVNTGKVIYHCHIGVVMTNRFFTSGAKQAAEATGVLLWDRNKIQELLNNVSKE